MDDYEISKKLREALAAGRRMGLEEAAGIAESRHEHWNSARGHGVSCDVTACEDIAQAIRNLKDE